MRATVPSFSLEGEDLLTSTLKYSIERGTGGTIRAVLSGAIDEHSDLAGLFKSLDNAVVFDLQGITRINSIGIRLWLPFIGKLSSEHSVTFRALSYAMVNQANCIANLFGSAKLDTCMAPYFCSKCGTNEMFEVTTAEVAAKKGPPDRTCASCKGALEFDELESYFNCLYRREG